MAFLARAQVILMLMAQGTHFEGNCFGKYCLTCAPLRIRVAILEGEGESEVPGSLLKCNSPPFILDLGGVLQSGEILCSDPTSNQLSQKSLRLDPRKGIFFFFKAPTVILILWRAHNNCRSDFESMCWRPWGIHGKTCPR